MNIYNDAMMSQGACNLGGLVRGWARTMELIQAEAHAQGKGTDWINTHPVNVLFAEQIYQLTGFGQKYSDAYAAVQAGMAQS
jgi:hypothetical protein